MRLRYKRRAKQKKLFSRKDSIAFLAFIVGCLFFVMLFWIILDNSRVAVQQETCIIPTLPKSLEGYTVLQLSDLHGQRYGPDHAAIAEALNGRAYDVVLITGDLVDDRDSESQMQNTIDLFAWFASQGKQVYYVLGNHDPAMTVMQNGAASLHPFYQALNDTGAIYLNAPVALHGTNKRDSLWLWPVELLAVTSQQAQVQLDIYEGRALTALEEMQKAPYEGVIDALENTADQDPVLVISHYPLSDARVEDLAARTEGTDSILPKVDLALCGHFHNGQWRLPLLGALYVPSQDLGLGGFFPDNDLIHGFCEAGGLDQYISGGLGSTSVLGMQFRILATPEINLITLTSTVR